MSAKIEAITFDWYGTLANHRHKVGRDRLFLEYLASHGLQSASWDRQVLYDVFDYYGSGYRPESSDQQKRIFWVQFTELLFERSHVRGGTANQSEFHAAAIRDIFGSSCFELYVDVRPVLYDLKRQGLRLAVVSNWLRGLDSFCHEVNLSSLLDTVISSSDIGIEKPDRRLLSLSMKTIQSLCQQLLELLRFRQEIIFYALILVSPFFRSRASLGCELVAIRSQLTFYKESIRQKKQTRPRFTPAFCLLWALLSAVWSGWKPVADLMQAKTVLKWYKRSFLLW